jgi:hypothetical protein
LGSVVVTHPFHPLNGRRLEVLFVKRRGDAVVFVCSGGLGGQMTLPLAWTDRGEAPATATTRWTWPAATIARSWSTVGEGKVPVNPPIGSTSSPPTTAPLVVASRYFALPRAE